MISPTIYHGISAPLRHVRSYCCNPPYLVTQTDKKSGHSLESPGETQPRPAGPSCYKAWLESPSPLVEKLIKRGCKIGWA